VSARSAIVSVPRESRGSTSLHRNAGWYARNGERPCFRRHDERTRATRCDRGDAASDVASLICVRPVASPVDSAGSVSTRFARPSFVGPAATEALRVRGNARVARSLARESRTSPLGVARNVPERTRRPPVTTRGDPCCISPSRPLALSPCLALAVPLGIWKSLRGRALARLISSLGPAIIPDDDSRRLPFLAALLSPPLPLLFWILARDRAPSGRSVTRFGYSLRALPAALACHRPASSRSRS
jgi:hypothetical protein